MGELRANIRVCAAPIEVYYAPVVHGALSIWGTTKGQCVGSRTAPGVGEALAEGYAQYKDRRCANVGILVPAVST